MECICRDGFGRKVNSYQAVRSFLELYHVRIEVLHAQPRGPEVRGGCVGRAYSLECTAHMMAKASSRSLIG
jgi:hypothetical protein